MPRSSFVAGNWKMNTTRASAVSLARDVARRIGDEPSVQVGVAPPFVYIDAVVQAVIGSSLLVGAQDVYFERSGAFTGEVSVEMLADLGVRFCLAGHSERRHVLNEPPQLTSRKAEAIYSGGLTLVHCVGETLAQRDASQTLAVVQSQLEELSPGRFDDPGRLVIAYEPVWAIGTGRNATDDQAQEVHAFIRDVIADRWNPEFGYEVRIIYGGSLKPDNAKALFGRNDVDGGLVGGASLSAESFLAIVSAATTAAGAR